MPSGQYAGPATIGSMPDTETHVRYGIRLPIPLRDAARNKATTQGHTLNTAINALLAAYVAGTVTITEPSPALLDDVRNATDPHVRRESIRAARAAGHSDHAIAAAAGVTAGRIRQLAPAPLAPWDATRPDPED